MMTRRETAWTQLPDLAILSKITPPPTKKSPTKLGRAEKQKTALRKARFFS